MSDIASDLYPIPVSFVDGQQPTAALLNGWADQIDHAFLRVSQLLGDYDGSGEGADTYISSTIRSIGDMGLINIGLPDGVSGFIKEKLAAWEGKKEAVLTFTPDVTPTDEDIEVDDLGVAVEPNEDFPGTVLTSGGRFTFTGKRLLTSSPIADTAWIIYPIDTFRTSNESGVKGSGYNVIPSIAEIFSELDDLCTIDKPVGYADNEYRITFPDIRRIFNTRAPLSIHDNDVIKLDDEDSLVAWDTTGDHTAPKWRIPKDLIDLSDNDFVFPSNMFSLWFADDATIQRVTSPTSQLISWKYLSISSVKITIPEDMTLPALPGDADDSRYIVGCAGTSLATALGESISHLRAHSHNGEFGDTVKAKDISDFFDPEKFYHSALEYNPAPQYLLREGYSPDDVLNKRNAMVGHLLMAAITTGLGNTLLPESNHVADSNSIVFGHWTSGPRFYFDFSDNAGDALADKMGKLVLDRKSLRVAERLFIGPEGNVTWLEVLDLPTAALMEHKSSLDEDETTFASGRLQARAGLLDLATGDGGFIHGTATLDDDVADIEFSGDDPTRVTTNLGFFLKPAVGTEFRAKIPLGLWQVPQGGTGGYTASTSVIAAGVRTLLAGGSLHCNLHIPTPQALGFNIDPTTGYKVKTVEVRIYGETADPENDVVDNPSSFLLKVDRQTWDDFADGPIHAELESTEVIPNIATGGGYGGAIVSVSNPDDTPVDIDIEEYIVTVIVDAAGDTFVGVSGCWVTFEVV